MGQTRKASLGWIAAGILALLISAGGFVGWRVSHALKLAREEVRSGGTIRFHVRPFSPPTELSFEVVSAPAVFLQAARFENHFFIAGPAGLLEYDLAGAPVRQFAVGRDLPGSPLVALATGILADSREPELIVATAQDGLLAYNGRSFRQIYPEDSSARGITSILPAGSGHLLIGTKERGVLVFDGKQMSALHPTLEHLYVTVLAGSESDLWVGTLNQGLLRWHAGATESFTEEQGLPDRQVQAIATAGEKTYVGTVMGVAVFNRSRFSHVMARGVLTTALFSTGANLVVGTEDQGVLTIPLEGQRRGSRSGGSVELAEVRQVFASREEVYVLTRSAMYRMNSRGLGWQKVLKPDPATLSDANVSALAADGRGRIWVGYFDRGLDVLQAESGRAAHVENEHVYCVNRILPEAKNGTVAVATANGLVRFDASGKQEQVLTRADGLIADHVTDVAPYGDGLAVATPAGLTFLDAGGARSMYAFHGLVNNHVYALGVSGDELMVGTLGGLSVIGRETVRTNYTTSNSGLKHNWITAVVPVDDEWMVGTYGAGVLGLDRAGRFHAFEKATAPVEVNPNAMLVTPRHVLAGTLGHGLYVYERETQRWSEIHDGLPSANVTALARANGYLYVGTDNGLVRIPEEKLLP